MLKALNKEAARLWKDESGVVLAFTVIVFLALFVMACSVYAVGETVRLRVEVQNAADAAAYSGAIVQADCNSRVAALNRAMSWCYVQMGRMEMDYIVDRWLRQTVEDFDHDDDKMMWINFPSDCHHGEDYYGTGYGVSFPNPIGSPEVMPAPRNKIRLNGHRMETRDSIDDATDDARSQGRNYEALAGPIDTCRDNINALNAKEEELITKLPSRIKKTVETILKGNISDTWNDGFAGGGGIMYSLLQEESPLENNFRVLAWENETDEDDFLRHSNYIPDQGDTTDQVLGTGAGDWYVKEYVTPGPGIQRGYQRGNPRLISEWNWFSSTWTWFEGKCWGAVSASGHSEVYGDDSRIYDERYYTTALAKPRVLKETFFAQGGSLVVGVTRKVNNPFQFMAVGGKLGVISPFTLVDNAGKQRYMWTASAAISGYNPKPPQDCEGKYEVTYEDNTGNKLWNLKTSDWDAELIPLHRVLAQGKNHAWIGGVNSAGITLNKLRGGPWTALYGGGDALGDQGGPKGMNEGAEIAYGGAEGWVVH